MNSHTDTAATTERESAAAKSGFRWKWLLYLGAAIALIIAAKYFHVQDRLKQVLDWVGDSVRGARSSLSRSTSWRPPCSSLARHDSRHGDVCLSRLAGHYRSRASSAYDWRVGFVRCRVAGRCRSHGIRYASGKERIGQEDRPRRVCASPQGLMSVPLGFLSWSNRLMRPVPWPQEGKCSDDALVHLHRPGNRS